jgi:hypothetical protein
MLMTTAERRGRAERLRDYFALQLLFARHVAWRAAMPLEDAVARYTNLHRRFGLGDGGDRPRSRPWMHYVGELVRLRTDQERLEWTLACFIAAPQERPPANEEQFGCFGCTPPDAGGVIRFHFTNKHNGGGAGPLSRTKISARVAELRSMFTFIRQNHPSAAIVEGASWLYNLEAYRRLFPPEYGASRYRPPRVRLTGSSSWGQFLDHHGAVKPALREVFLRNLQAMDVAAPWLAFPLPALRTSAPVERFYTFYHGEVVADRALDPHAA